MTMTGLWIDAQGLRLRRDLSPPPPVDHETSLRLRVAGVCATDLALARGYMGFVGTPGHEFVAEALDGPLAGRRVVGDINAGCGSCALCRGGDPRHCSRRTVLGILARPGAFAERFCLPTRNLVAVPDGVPDEAAVFAEPLAAAYRIREQLELVPNSTALVAGDGRLGLLIAMVLAEAGLEVTVAGRHPERIRLLPPGVLHRVGLLEDPGAAARNFDLAVEATGQPSALPRIAPLLRPGATLVLKTTSEAAVPLDLAPFVVDEIRIVGSRCGPIPVALDALAEGRIPARELVEARYPLAQAEEAFAHAGRGGTLKVLVDGPG